MTFNRAYRPFQDSLYLENLVSGEVSTCIRTTKVGEDNLLLQGNDCQSTHITENEERGAQ